MKAARIIAIMFSKSTKLDLKKELTDVNYFLVYCLTQIISYYFLKVFQTLIDMISANRKDIKLKQALLPTLGELLYAVSLQVKN